MIDKVTTKTPSHICTITSKNLVTMVTKTPVTIETINIHPSLLSTITSDLLRGDLQGFLDNSMAVRV